MKKVTLYLTIVLVFVATLPKKLVGQKTATSWTEFSNGFPLSVNKPNDLPEQTGGNPLAKAVLNFYTDRAIFDAAFPGLPLEDFEAGNAGPSAIVACDKPVDENSNGACFSPGDLITGFAVQTFQVSGTNMILLGSGLIGNADIIVGPDTFGEDLLLTFSPPVLQAGMDIHTPGTETFNITITHTDGTDITTANANGAGLFWGVSSDALISSIRIVSPSGQSELIDNLVFGGGALVAGGSVPTLSQWGLIILAMLLMTLGTLYLVQPNKILEQD